MSARVNLRRDGDKLRISVEADVDAEQAAMLPAIDAPAMRPNDREYIHAKDYSAVVWRGKRHTFTRKQRRVVAALMQAREEGTDFMSQESLLDIAESDQQRLRELFRDHPAWGTMIVAGPDCGGPLGTYRLAE